MTPDNMTEPFQARPIGVSLPTRWAFALAIVVAAGFLIWHFTRSHSEQANLTAAVRATHSDAICGQVGVMAFAGGRSNLYGCTWTSSSSYATTRHCEVWANGLLYDVTKTARAIFKLQGQPSPC
jgi:hypothetical protein